MSEENKIRVLNDLEDIERLKATGLPLKVEHGVLLIDYSRASQPLKMEDLKHD